MRPHFTLLCCLMTLIISCQQADPSANAALTYPTTAQEKVVEDYFGTEVADPYRWLENDTSAAVGSWVASQNGITQEYLSEIPFRAQIFDRLKSLWNFEKYSAPRKEGAYYFFSKNDGLQNQSVMYIQRRLEDSAEVFIDPNTFSADGTIAMAGGSFSHDGKYYAYLVTESGSDWRTIRVMDVEKRELLSDHIRWAKFTGIAWEGNGFYYSSYDRPAAGQELTSFNFQHKIYFHQLGTPQETDRLIFGGESQSVRYANASVSEDEQYLFVYGAQRTNGNSLYFRKIAQPNTAWTPIIEDFDHNHDVIHSNGNQLYILTDWDAPNKRIVVADARSPQPQNWKDLIPEQASVLADVDVAGGKMFIEYLENASSRVYQYDLEGNLEKEIELPTLGSVSGFNGKAQDTEVFYTFTSFTYPATIYRYDISTGASQAFFEPQVDFVPENYETHQVFYPSKDGTKVSMFIVHRKGLIKDGTHPTYLYGYGGFNVSLTPSFSPLRIAWLENGGVFAMPNLRGGGEYGKEWHKAGIKMSKQNVFDDFIAAGEYLIHEGYTSSEKLAIFGGSNGGLLVGAAMTQRPELFGVAVPAVGVMDMLRYHKFTAGAGWIYDYGCADSSQQMFEYLLGYSPVHNIKEGVSYPATLVKTADHDDRVVPAHSFKFISHLQAKHTGNSPVLIRIESKAGHGGGKPTQKILEEWADTYAFVYKNMQEAYKPQRDKVLEPKYN